MVWHIHGGKVPELNIPVSFALLLNLVSAANANSKELIWGFVSKYAPEATPENAPFIDHLVGYALAYYEDFVKPAKEYRAPTDQERAALEELVSLLRAYDGPVTGEDLQTLTFTAGKSQEFENLRDWFKAIYEVCLGQSQGPRFGGFIAIYGVDETADLIEAALKGEFV